MTRNPTPTSAALPPVRPRCPRASLDRSVTGAERLTWLVELTLLVAALIFAPPAPVLAQVQGDQGLQGGWAIGDDGSVGFTHSVSEQAPIMRQAGAGWVRINFRLGACYQD